MIRLNRTGSFLVVIAAATVASRARAQYVEVYQSWEAANASTWEVKDLSGAPFNVPANAVVEVAIRCKASSLRSGGVRAVGSSLERRFNLYGDTSTWDVAVMHVQADASSQIEHYSENKTQLDFLLLGYWDSGTYVEAYNSFTSSTTADWEDHDLDTYGVGAGEIAEIVVTQTSTTNARTAGVRTNGSSLDRTFSLTPPNSGSAVEPITMFVQADSATADATIEIYAQVTPQVDFYLVGYWTANPEDSTTLRYVGRFSDIGSPTSDATWQDEDLSSYDVPAGAVAEIALGNTLTSEDNNMGVRENGSSLGRLLDLQAATGGGGEYGRMHVETDSAATIELYHEDVSDDHEFILTGYWAPAGVVVTESGGTTEVQEGCSTDTYTVVLEAAPAASVHVTADPDDQTNLGSGVGVAIQLTFSTTNWSTAQTVTVTPVNDMVEEGNHTSTITHTTSSTDSGYDGLTVDSVVADIADSGSFTLTNLGALGSDSSFGYGINDNEHMTGHDSDPNDIESAWYWDGDSLTGLGALGGTSSEGQDINNSAEVVGLAETASGDIHAFIWDSGSGMQDLGTLSGRTDSEALAINENSEVVGTSLIIDGTPGAWLAFIYLPAPAYSLPAGMSSLGTLGGNGSVAMGVNDLGQVVGGAQNSSNNMRPFLWLPTAAYGLSAGMNDLGTLGGESAKITHRAQAINSYGEVVGLSYTAGGDAHAFIWLPAATYGLSSGMNDLGTLTGGDTSWAFGINDDGRVVGTSNITGGDFHAFVWQDGTMYDLNDLLDPNDGWELLWATDINADGEITGWGTNGSGDTRALMLGQPCSGGAEWGGPPPDEAETIDLETEGALLTPTACGTGACGTGIVPFGMLGMGAFIGLRAGRLGKRYWDFRERKHDPKQRDLQ